MPTAGPKSTSSVTTAQVGFSDTVDWSDPGNAVASDETFATVSLAQTDGSYALRCTGFGFTSSDVPPGATINGILVEVEAHQNGDAVNTASPLVYGGSQVDTLNYLGNPFSGAGNAGFAPNSTDDYWPLGGPTDTGGGVTQAMVVDSSFGIDIYFSVGGFSAGSDVSVDHVRMTVYYTAPGFAEGEATIFCTSTVTAAGARVKAGTASPAGAGTCSAVGASTKVAAASIAGTATLAGAGTKVLGGVTAIACVTAFTAAGASFASGAGSISGTVFAAAAGASIKGGAATITATSSLAAAGASISSGAGAITGIAALAAASSSVAAGASILSGSGTLAGAGSLVAAGAAAIAGLATVTADAGRKLPAPSWRTARGTIQSRRVNAGGAIRTVDAGRSA